MNLAKLFAKRIKHVDDRTLAQEALDECCPNCEANLTKQKGYRNDLPYWICTGCGEMLINPQVDADSNIAWICDQCEAMLNVQKGFSEDCGEWKCTECGYVNKIDASELYASDDEYRADLKNPYKGLSDRDALELSLYEDMERIHDREDVILIRDKETGERFIKKILATYDKSVYDFLMEHPIEHMPHIRGLYESSNSLIVLEEYIEGTTIAEMLDEGVIEVNRAIRIIIEICRILDKLHELPRPIIHRDVKPSNVILTPDDEVFLLDMNVAKWYQPEQKDDTRYLGTEGFAAPEQVGYGFSASSPKSDIYAVGMLLNVMLTGNLPKEKRTEGRVWDIIERCISLEADKRYTTRELLTALETLSGEE